MNKESFLIYKSFYEPIKYLTDEQLGRLFRAIFEYQMGNEVNIENDIRIAFEFFKNQFRVDDKKYQKVIERNKNNGKKGGRPKNPKEPKKPSGLFGNPKEPKKADNDNDNDNENDNDNDNENNNVVVDFFNNNFRMITPFEYEKIKYWIEDLSEELVLEALKECVNKNVRTMSYLEAILNNWKALNYKSVNDIKNKKVKEPTPEWLDKKVEKKEASEKEKKEIEAMLNEFKEEKE